MGLSGGSAGPLYGTLLGGLGGPLADENTLDGPMLKKMLAASLAAMREISKAGPDDKTMMDALIPAVLAAQAASDDPAELLRAAAAAAVAGAESTKGKISKFGRARSYGERTIGSPDAGAVSTALLFQGLYDGFSKPL
jgi:dihydroxyacetone kinase-like protein